MKVKTLLGHDLHTSEDNQTIQNQIAYVELEWAVRSQTLPHFTSRDPATEDHVPKCFKSWFDLVRFPVQRCKNRTCFDALFAVCYFK